MAGATSARGEASAASGGGAGDRRPDRVDWSRTDLDQFRIGSAVELEHGLRDPATNVTDDEETTGKIALAHLNEIPDYYTRLLRTEAEAEGKPAP